MSLLVTGATGEIGRSLIELLRCGEEIRVLSRHSQPSASEGLQWVQGDLREIDDLSRACKGIDRVLHMAAITHARRVADYHSVNVAGTVNLLRVACDAGVKRFVYVSTRAIGAAGGAYSYSKELAEAEVRRANLPWVILRPAEVYGGGDNPILSLVSSLRRRSFVPIVGDGSYRLCPVHVGDVVDGIVRALDHESVAGRTYLLAGPEEMTYLELVGRIETILGLSPRRRIHVPVLVARLVISAISRLGLGEYVPDQIPRLLLGKSSDISEAVRDLGFSPRVLEAGLEASS